MEYNNNNFIITSRAYSHHSVVECSSSASTMVGLGGMAQQGLRGGHMMIDARKEVAPSSAVVASMASLASLMHGSLSEYEFEEDGVGDFG
jgi:hypothetical protein